MNKLYEGMRNAVCFYRLIIEMVCIEFHWYSFCADTVENFKGVVLKANVFKENLNGLELVLLIGMSIIWILCSELCLACQLASQTLIMDITCKPLNLFGSYHR